MIFWDEKASCVCTNLDALIIQAFSHIRTEWKSRFLGGRQESVVKLGCSEYAALPVQQPRAADDPGLAHVRISEW